MFTAVVRSLPKPIGLMACNDDRGRQVLDACRRGDILVPDEVAVLGTDNDQFLCNLADPPLSSVDLDLPTIGYEAAAVLDRMMAGAPVPAAPVLLPPRGVVVRRSTDVLATGDRALAEAIRHLRDHACSGLRLKDFLKTTSLSRRTLERRTRQLLGHSPKEEITRVQLERARRLLAETELKVAAVAENCGFTQAKYFCQVFRRRCGITPAAFRREARGRKNSYC
jgi:LacI family transcriptional regulator